MCPRQLEAAAMEPPSFSAGRRAQIVADLGEITPRPKTPGRPAGRAEPPGMMVGQAAATTRRSAALPPLLSPPAGGGRGVSTPANVFGQTADGGPGPSSMAALFSKPRPAEAEPPADLRRAGASEQDGLLELAGWAGRPESEPEIILDGRPPPPQRGGTPPRPRGAMPDQLTAGPQSAGEQLPAAAAANELAVLQSTRSRSATGSRQTWDWHARASVPPLRAGGRRRGSHRRCRRTISPSLFPANPRSRPAGLPSRLAATKRQKPVSRARKAARLSLRSLICCPSPPARTGAGGGAGQRGGGLRKGEGSTEGKAGGLARSHSSTFAGGGAKARPRITSDDLASSLSRQSSLPPSEAARPAGGDETPKTCFKSKKSSPPFLEVSHLLPPHRTAPHAQGLEEGLASAAAACERERVQRRARQAEGRRWRLSVDGGESWRTAGG